MVKMTKQQKKILEAGDKEYKLKVPYKTKKKKIKFPPQDTSTDIICGDPTEDYRF